MLPFPYLPPTPTGIIKHIDNISEQDIASVHIPNGTPLVYKFTRNMKPIRYPDAVSPLSGQFLEKTGLLKSALEKERLLAMHVPGFNVIPTASTGSNAIAVNTLAATAATKTSSSPSSSADGYNSTAPVPATPQTSSPLISVTESTVEVGEAARTSKQSVMPSYTKKTKFESVIAGQVPPTHPVPPHLCSTSTSSSMLHLHLIVYASSSMLHLLINAPPPPTHLCSTSTSASMLHLHFLIYAPPPTHRFDQTDEEQRRHQPSGRHPLERQHGSSAGTDLSV